MASSNPPPDVRVRYPRPLRDAKGCSASGGPAPTSPRLAAGELGTFTHACGSPAIEDFPDSPGIIGRAGPVRGAVLT